LWVKSNGEIFGGRYLYKLVKEVAKRAGIEKKIWPYLFRHSRGTQLYKKYGEAIAKKYMGHSPNSRMAAVYNHLNDEDVYEALSGKKKDALVDDKTCPRCERRNTYGSDRCSKCGLALTLAEASKPKVSEDQVKTIVGSMLRDAGYNVAKIEKIWE